MKQDRSIVATVVGIVLAMVVAVWMFISLASQGGPPAARVSPQEAERIARQAWHGLTDQARTPVERAQFLASLYDYREAISRLVYEAVDGDEWKVSLNGSVVVGTMDRSDPNWCGECVNKTFEAIQELPTCDALRACVVIDALAGGVAHTVFETNPWVCSAGFQLNAIKQAGLAAESGSCAGGERAFLQLREKHLSIMTSSWDASPVSLPRRFIMDRMIEDCCRE